MNLTVLQGKIAKFSGNGRKLGYPTANIAVDAELPDGIYFGYADLAVYKHWPALVFVGKPVTVADDTHRVEAHLLDIEDKDYYDSLIKIQIAKKHRDNMAFDSLKQLKLAMKKDEITARIWFSAAGNGKGTNK